MRNSNNKPRCEKLSLSKCPSVVGSVNAALLHICLETVLHCAGLYISLCCSGQNKCVWISLKGLSDFHQKRRQWYLPDGTLALGLRDNDFGFATGCSVHVFDTLHRLPNCEGRQVSIKISPLQGTQFSNSDAGIQR